PPPPSPPPFPYTTLFRSVFALTASAPDLCRPAFTWLKNSQLEDGSWGWFGKGTPEETAYAVQALMTAPAETIAAMTEPLARAARSEEHTSELQSRFDLVC